jgi:hypothetical protein
VRSENQENRAINVCGPEYELARAAKFGNAQAAQLFAKLRINEKRGDRLLMLGHIP